MSKQVHRRLRRAVGSGRVNLIADALEGREMPSASLLTPGLPPITPADGDSSQILAVSDDAKVILFSSKATNLVTGVNDTNAVADLFWRDLATGTTKIVSVTPGGIAQGFDDATAGNAVLSGDGKFVAYVSKTDAAVLTGVATVTDLVDTNDVFRWEAATGTNKIASLRIDGKAVGNAAGEEALRPNISTDGQFVAYASKLATPAISATTIFDQAATVDLFRRDMTAAQATDVVTSTPFVAANPFLFAGKNSAIGFITDVSLPIGNYMSGNGKLFTYETKADADLIFSVYVPPFFPFIFGQSVPGAVGDQADTRDVFVRDITIPISTVLPNTATVLVSVAKDGKAVGNVAAQEAFGPILSVDGKNVLFVSNAPGGNDGKQLVGGYTSNGAATDLYIRVNVFDAAAATELISTKNGTTSGGANASVDAGSYAMTPDGTFVVFNTKAFNLVDATLDANNDTDVYLRNRSATPATELISVGSNGKTGSLPSTGLSLSADGKFVVFQTASTGFLDALIDTNTASDVFVRDRVNLLTRPASTIPAGRATGNGASTGGVVAPDGSQVFFASTANNLVAPFGTGTTANLYTNAIPLVNPLALPTSMVASGTADGKAQTFTFDAAGQLVAGTTFNPFGGFTGDVRAATGDIDGDGKDDVAYGVGPTGGSDIRIRTATGKDIVETVYEAGFTGGVFLAVGDIDGDGRAEIVVSPDQGGGGRVVIFRLNAAGTGLDRVADFFGIEDTSFRGGARVAVGDLNADGIVDVVVAAGFGGGPRVALFDGKTVLAGAPGIPPKLRADFFVFEQTLRNGVFIATGDFNGDGSADPIFAGGPGGGPRILILSAPSVLANPDPTTTAPIANFFAGDSTQRGGIHVTAKDIDGDGFADLIAGSGEDLAGEIRTYRGTAVTAAASGTEPTLLQTFATFGGSVINAGVFVG